MLDLQEVIELKDDKQYKKTTHIFYNFKFTKGLTTSSLVPNISFSLNTNMIATLGLSQVLFANLFKRFIIAKEIGEIRNKIIETVINNTLQIDNLSDFFESNYLWFEDCDAKIELLKSITHDFLSDSKIENIIFSKCKHLSYEQKVTEYNKLLKEISNLYSIATINSKSNKIIKNQDDYYNYICRSGLEVDVVSRHQNFGILTDKGGKQDG